jgi:hypothetical protein
MVRSLDAFRILLGLPVYRSVVGEASTGARVAAHWSCGCVAAGTSFKRLTLTTCRSHRAGRIEVPPAVAI